MCSVLITGASRDIGLACAEVFAKSGHDLILLPEGSIGWKNYRMTCGRRG